MRTWQLLAANQAYLGKTTAEVSTRLDEELSRMYSCAASMALPSRNSEKDAAALSTGRLSASPYYYTEAIRFIREKSVEAAYDIGYIFRSLISCLPPQASSPSRNTRISCWTGLNSPRRQRRSCAPFLPPPRKCSVFLLHASPAGQKVRFFHWHSPAVGP